MCDKDVTFSSSNLNIIVMKKVKKYSFGFTIISGKTVLNPYRFSYTLLEKEGVDGVLRKPFTIEEVNRLTIDDWR